MANSGGGGKGGKQGRAAQRANVRKRIRDARVPF